MGNTTSRLSLALWIGLLAVISTQAGSLEPPPGPVSPTRPPDTCFDNTGNRFVDCGDGTIKDTQTGLFWLKDADCFLEQWAAANVRAAELAHGQCGLTDGSLPGDWRLPTLQCPAGGTCALDEAVGEFATILAPSCPDPAILDTSGDGCWSEGDPFTDVQTFFYWSATSYAPNPTGAWIAALLFGGVGTNDKSSFNYVWPVRGGP
jgi:hypothetical protein